MPKRSSVTEMVQAAMPSNMSKAIGRVAEGRELRAVRRESQKAGASALAGQKARIKSLWQHVGSHALQAQGMEEDVTEKMIFWSVYKKEFAKEARYDRWKMFTYIDAATARICCDPLLYLHLLGYWLLRVGFHYKVITLPEKDIQEFTMGSELKVVAGFAAIFYLNFTVSRFFDVFWTMHGLSRELYTTVSTFCSCLSLQWTDQESAREPYELCRRVYGYTICAYVCSFADFGSETERETSVLPFIKARNLIFDPEEALQFESRLFQGQELLEGRQVNVGGNNKGSRAGGLPHLSELEEGDIRISQAGVSSSDLGGGPKIQKMTGLQKRRLYSCFYCEKRIGKTPNRSSAENNSPADASSYVADAEARRAKAAGMKKSAALMRALQSTNESVDPMQNQLDSGNAGSGVGLPSGATLLSPVGAASRTAIQQYGIDVVDDLLTQSVDAERACGQMVYRLKCQVAAALRRGWISPPQGASLTARISNAQELSMKLSNYREAVLPYQFLHFLVCSLYLVTMLTVVEASVKDSQTVMSLTGELQPSGLYETFPYKLAGFLVLYFFLRFTLLMYSSLKA
ncbi:unnamed protein product [Amoebophrya sp. A25]|nr:unnamed protein product [Amoebophrya sp. A25]|eukprot:GSA25T00003193001.1